MQAVILAAGLGRRLGALTEHSTKCMVQLNGRRLIEYTLDSVVECGLKRIVLVVGHGAEEVRHFLGNAYRDVPIEYVENGEYRQTNNIYSLLLAAEHLCADDSVIIESDVLFTTAILENCLADPAPNIAVVAPYRSEMDGTVVLVDEQREIVRFVPRAEFAWSDCSRYYKTVNIYKLSKEFLTQRFVPFLRTYVQTEGRNAYYEEVLRLLVFMGHSELVALPVVDQLWYEIDDPNDLDIASTLFAADRGRRAQLEKRYGGYWRFPQLRDFLYLVNPYFPTRGLLEELSHALPELVTRYPSGARIQRLLGARLVACDPSLIAIGNGASELIAALLTTAQLSNARIGVVTPTFEEYLRPFGNQTVVEIPSMGKNAPTSSAEIVDLCAAQQLSAVVLVNPANPTGMFLERDRVIQIAEDLHRAGVVLILDESFVDFVDGSSRHSLIEQYLLERLPNLVVIKSISKSYGVPALRLGVLASAHRGLVDEVAGRLPIWNINSFAEYFLQIMGKYETAYWRACKFLVDERERFACELATLSFLRVLPSCANFIMCEVLGDWTGRDLADALARDHWILIKDCTGKRGLPVGSYVRIAVRGAEDNDALVAALRTIGRTNLAARVAGTAAAVV